MTTPPAETVERWAFDYVTTTRLAHKLAPPPAPRAFASSREPLRVERPGRPSELEVAVRAPKSPGPEAIRAPHRRAELVHTFLHHEVQAAELMGWAILAFPGAPVRFRRGLAAILADECRHARLYEGELARLGYGYGSFPVRDWFWLRVPGARSPAEFVAVMSMGFEGGNLDHVARFAERFRAIGDEEGARIQERIGKDEIAHVRFGARWFRRFTGKDDFATWRAHLPAPLSPLVMRGHPLDEAARLRAELAPELVRDLAAFVPDR